MAHVSLFICNVCSRRNTLRFVFIIPSPLKVKRKTMKRQKHSSSQSEAFQRKYSQYKNAFAEARNP